MTDTPLSTYIAEQTAAERALRLALPLLVLDLEVTIDGSAAFVRAAGRLGLEPIPDTMADVDHDAAQLRLDAIRAAEACVGRAWQTDAHQAWLIEIIDGTREL